MDISKNNRQWDAQLISINWKTGLIRETPLSQDGIKSKDLEFHNFQYLEKTDELIIHLNAQFNIKKSTDYLIIIDREGDIKSVTNLSNKVKQYILDFSVANIGSNEYAIAGTSSPALTTSSQELFFCTLKNKTISTPVYRKFSELTSFMGFLGNNALEKVQKKKLDKGKSMLRNFRIILKDLVHQQDGYVLIGESYHSVTSKIGSGESASIVFEGLNTTHAFLAKFSLNGELLWDQILTLNTMNTKTHVPHHVMFVHKLANTDDFLFYRNGNNTVNIQSVRAKDGLLQKIDNFLIEGNGNPTGELASWAEYSFSFWYDRYIISLIKGNPVSNKLEKKLSARFVDYWYITKASY